MRRKITISTGSSPDDIRLSNGDLIVIKDKVFLVSTYGSQCDIDADNNYTGNVRNYCSFINMTDGSRVFKSPTPRDCTKSDLASRFRNMFDFTPAAGDINHIKSDNYDLHIQVK
jgi:hypothetical protein